MRVLREFESHRFRQFGILFVLLLSDTSASVYISHISAPNGCFTVFDAWHWGRAMPEFLKLAIYSGAFGSRITTDWRGHIALFGDWEWVN